MRRDILDTQPKSYYHSLALKAYPYCWALCYFSAACFSTEVFHLLPPTYPYNFSVGMFIAASSLGTILLFIRIRELYGTH